MVEIRVAPKKEADAWVRELHRARPSIALGILLGGDRWTCVDIVLLASLGEENVGIVTIASRGEMAEGVPTIVALYVLPKYRCRGIGLRLLEAAIDHMLSLELKPPIRIDITSRVVLRMLSRLPITKREKLNMVDCTFGGLTGLEGFPGS